MTRKPLVTIGVPVYNADKFLEETLDSLLAQTFEDFEIIISDNASTDSTESICQAYMAKDSRIRYVRNESNLGAAFNYNQTFELSSTKYFKWAAADDLCAPQYLEKCVLVLERRPEIILCYSRTIVINEHGQVMKKAIPGPDLDLPSITTRFHHGIIHISHCNAIFGLVRSDILRKTRLIESYTPSDKVLLEELTLHGHFFELPAYLFFRRKHAAASGADKSIEAQQEFFEPNTKGKVFLFSWNFILKNFSIVRNAPAGPIQKGRMLLSVVWWMIGHRKRLVAEPFVGLMCLLGYRHTAKIRI